MRATKSKPEMTLVRAAIALFLVALVLIDGLSFAMWPVDASSFTSWAHCSLVRPTDFMSDGLNGASWPLITDFLREHHLLPTLPACAAALAGLWLAYSVVEIRRVSKA
jgi:hypothetical protein